MKIMKYLIIAMCFFVISCEKGDPVYTENTSIGRVLSIGKMGEDRTITISQNIISKSMGFGITYIYNNPAELNKNLLGKQVLYTYKQCNNNCDESTNGHKAVIEKIEEKN